MAVAPKKRILLIEDEEEIASLIKLQADAAGYQLHVEVDGINGYHTIEREKPDLVLLDLMLPGMHGLDVCRKMRANSLLRHIPIIIISSKGSELDVVLGLELGADDYVTKPFSLQVLLARIKAVLRRSDLKKEPASSSKTTETPIIFGSFTLELRDFILRKDDRPIPLTLSEFGILRRLASNPGKVLTRTQLLDDIQHDDALIVDRNIDVHIASLRKKLGPTFDWIETVRGVGYRFREPEDADTNT